MKNLRTYILVVVLVLAVALVYLQSYKKYVAPLTPHKPIMVESCTEGKREYKGFDIFECIDGKMIYVGQLNPNKG